MKEKHTHTHLFEQLYRAEADNIFRYIFFKISDREEAQDITAHAFEKLWHEIWKGKRLDNPRSYLLRITRNLIIDWYRKKKPESLDSFEEGFDIKDGDTPLASEIFDGKEALASFARVSASYRDVLYFRFVEGLEPREIADLLKMSPNSVSIRIHRGLEELRKILNTET